MCDFKELHLDSNLEQKYHRILEWRYTIKRASDLNQEGGNSNCSQKINYGWYTLQEVVILYSLNKISVIGFIDVTGSS